MKSGATSLGVSEKDNSLIVSADIRNEVANEVISDGKKRKKNKKKSSGTNSSNLKKLFFSFFVPALQKLFIFVRKNGRK